LTSTSTSSLRVLSILEPPFNLFARLTMHQPEVIDPDYESREDLEYEARQEILSIGIKAAIQKRLDKQRPQGPAIVYDIPRRLHEKARKYQPGFRSPLLSSLDIFLKKSLPFKDHFYPTSGARRTATKCCTC
jgi:hypothetical protein